MDLGKVIEMLVAGEQRESVLDHQRRDPQVMGRNWRTLPAELSIEVSVRVRRRFRRKQHGDSRFSEKALKSTLVLVASSSHGKSTAQLGDDDEWHEDVIGSLQQRDDVAVTVDEIAVPVGVERDSQRQRSGSTLR
jgi:hypothetical protein